MPQRPRQGGRDSPGKKMEEIDGIYKVSAFDNAFSLCFLYDDCAEKLKSQQQIKCGSTSLDLMNMTEQIISIQVHWLPIFFYNNSIIQDMLSLYGDVLEVKMLTTEHAKLSTKNGIREVRLGCDEFGRQKLPPPHQF